MIIKKNHSKMNNLSPIIVRIVYLWNSFGSIFSNPSCTHRRICIFQLGFGTGRQRILKLYNQTGSIIVVEHFLHIAYSQPFCWNAVTSKIIISRRISYKNLFAVCADIQKGNIMTPSMEY